MEDRSSISSPGHSGSSEGGGHSGSAEGVAQGGSAEGGGSGGSAEGPVRGSAEGPVRGSAEGPGQKGSDQGPRAASITKQLPDFDVHLPIDEDDYLQPQSGGAAGGGGDGYLELIGMCA